jgi:hypothetical protein
MMRIKGLFIFVLLNISLLSMEGKKPVLQREEKKPALQRALSGLKNLISASKSESSSPEFSIASSPPNSEPQLARSRSSTLSEEETLRISGYLYELGFGPVNQYDRAQHAILDNNRPKFLDALSKLPKENLELQETLHRYWKIYRDGKEPQSGIFVLAKPENDILLNEAILQAAKEIWHEIEQSPPLVITLQTNQRRVRLPPLDFTHLPQKGSSIVRTLTESDQTASSSSSTVSSPSKSTIIKTIWISFSDLTDKAEHTQFEKEKSHHCGAAIKKEKK